MMKITAMGSSYQAAIETAITNTKKNLENKMGFVPRFMLTTERVQVLAYNEKTEVVITFTINIYESDQGEPITGYFQRCKS